jgi:hypothetical protein
LEAWKIQRDRSACDKPGCPLASSLEYFAVLELPECTRRDLCATCFHQLSASAPVQPIYWKARRRELGKRAPTLDLVSLRVLFERLGEVEGERAQGLRYFVALLLLRKRLLKMVDPQSEAEERADLVVIDPKVADAPRIALLAPEIDGERLANLKDELLAAIDETDMPEAGEDPEAAADGA